MINKTIKLITFLILIFTQFTIYAQEELIIQRKMT
jgi:hypothetical protein